MPAGSRDTLGMRSRLLQQVEPSRRQPDLVSLRHRVSTPGRWPEDQNAICYLCLGISQLQEYSSKRTID
jgi:hypothetical protein